jgi:GTPase SAR1 family protein
MAPTPQHVAVVIVGGGGVGKSAITLSFVRERYVQRLCACGEVQARGS